VNFMNQKLKPAPPFAGDLQIAVDRLPQTLVPVDRGGDAVDRARAARRACDETLREAREVLSKYNGRNVEDLAAVSARDAVTRAETQRALAVTAYRHAKERRDESFLAAASAQLDEAAPTLLEVARILNDATAPLAALHYHATMNQLPTPRLLAMLPALREATRIMTALANAATEPAKPKNDDED